MIFFYGIRLPASFVTNFASGRCSWSRVSCLPPRNMSVSKHPPGIPTSAYCVCAPCICCSNHAEGKRVLGTFTWTRWTSHPQGTNPTVWLLRHQQGRVTPTDSIATNKRSLCVVPAPCQFIWMAREPLCVSFAPHFPYFVARRHVSCSNLAHMLAFVRVNVCYTFLCWGKAWLWILQIVLAHYFRLTFFLGRNTVIAIDKVKLRIRKNRKQRC